MSHIERFSILSYSLATIAVSCRPIYTRVTPRHVLSFRNIYLLQLFAPSIICIIVTHVYLWGSIRSGELDRLCVAKADCYTCRRDATELHMHINAVSRARVSSTRQIESEKEREKEREGERETECCRRERCSRRVYMRCKQCGCCQPWPTGCNATADLERLFYCELASLANARVLRQLRFTRVAHLRVRSGRSTRFYARTLSSSSSSEATRGIASPRNEGTARLAKDDKSISRGEEKRKKVNKLIIDRLLDHEVPRSMLSQLA